MAGERAADPAGVACGADGVRRRSRRRCRGLSDARRIHAQGARHRLSGARSRRDPAGRAAGRRPCSRATRRRRRRCIAATCCSCLRSARRRCAATRRPRCSGSLAARERSLHGARAPSEPQLEAARIGALDRQIEGMQRELGSMAAEVDLQNQRLRSRKRRMARLEVAARPELRLAGTGARQGRRGARREGAVAGASSGNAPRICARSPRCRRSAASCRCAAGRAGRDRSRPGRAGAAVGRERGARPRIVVRAPQDGVRHRACSPSRARA